MALIPRAPLRNLAEDDRFRRLDKLESYARGLQDRGKPYNWDGHILGYGDAAPIKPGWYVAHAQRQPAARYDVAKLIVGRLTSMVFGQDRFPEIKIEGDPDAEDYARTLATEARLKVKMTEARNLGGSEGTACLSFGFIRGAPRIKVHNAKHVTVLKWSDEEEQVAEVVFKAYSSPRVVYDEDLKRFTRRDFWEVTVWDTMTEQKWSQIPDAVAKTPDWQNWPSKTETHGYGFCPFYWIQNKPESADFDGICDFEGLEGTFDEINQLNSATTRGTKANVDPTLVVKMDPAANNGQVFKGGDNAIFSAGGAEYLELKGTAVQAAERQLSTLVNNSLNVAGVVLADPEKISGSAQSARALEIIFAPMLTNCDTFREQYGERGIKIILRDMLRVARAFAARPPIVDPITGATVIPGVILPDKVTSSVDPATGAVTTTVTKRVPGTSEQIVLNWRPYFPATWQDINQAATAMKTANGGKPALSQRSSVQAIAPLVGVEDVDAEMAQIEDEAEKDAEAAKDMMMGQASIEAAFAEPKDKAGEAKPEK
jgi:hypothetical protein